MEDDNQAGRDLFAEMLPEAPVDLYDRLDVVMRGWYIEEAKRRLQGE